MFDTVSPAVMGSSAMSDLHMPDRQAAAHHAWRAAGCTRAARWSRWIKPLDGTPAAPLC
ncbi:hypothetical protein ACFZB6_30510 [Streptomyces syringium]|uniref:hypothetical protein n=1 Tax=Streptomyces syringium TaxID=76729 RepID=UPI00339E826E